MSIARALVAIAAFSVSVAAASAQDVAVEASLDRERIGVEDALTLTVQVSGAEDGVAEPELPSMEGLRVVGISTSTEMSIVGGRMSSSRSFIYQLQPVREGNLTIGAIEVEVDGRTHRTEPLAVEVVAGSLAPTPSPSRSPFSRSRPREFDEDDVFARAEVSNERLYEGEQVVVTYWLYARHVPMGYELEDDPPLTGFWVEELESRRNAASERRVVDGREYYAFPLLRRILIPTRSGELVVPSLAFSTAFRLTSGDPWDLLSARASRPVTLRTPPVTLEVQPLPSEGRSGAFRGAVGRFDLEAELDRAEVQAGDAVALTITAAGKGHLRAVEPPSTPDLAGFRAFDPKTRESSRPTPSGLRSEKTWEYVLVPESAGVKELGPWELQYFDPDRERYVTASAGPLTLAVTGGAPSDVTGPSKREITVLREDIRYLKDPPARLGGRRSPYYESSLFYFTLAAPVLWNVALLAFLRHRDRERADARRFRSRRAQRMAKDRLRRAAALAAGGDKGFYEEIAAALYRFVGDKLGVSPSGLTPPGIDRMLDARRVDPETRRELLEVLERCEEARFTPGPRTRDEMEALKDRAEVLIVPLEKPLV